MVLGIFASSHVDNKRLTQQTYFTAPRIREVELNSSIQDPLQILTKHRVIVNDQDSHGLFPRPASAP